MNIYLFQHTKPEKCDYRDGAAAIAAPDEERAWELLWARVNTSWGYVHIEDPELSIELYRSIKDLSPAELESRDRWEEEQALEYFRERWALSGTLKHMPSDEGILAFSEYVE